MSTLYQQQVSVIPDGGQHLRLQAAELPKEFLGQMARWKRRSRGVVHPQDEYVAEICLRKSVLV